VIVPPAKEAKARSGKKPKENSDGEA